MISIYIKFLGNYLENKWSIEQLGTMNKIFNAYSWNYKVGKSTRKK